MPVTWSVIWLKTQLANWSSTLPIYQPSIIHPLYVTPKQTFNDQISFFFGFIPKTDGSILSLLCLHLIGGLITTLTFSLMMSTCQTLPESYQATRYTLLSSVEVFGKLMFTSLSGICIDLAGFTGAHIVYLFLSILPLRFLIKIKSD